MILLTSLDEARYERSAGEMSRLISRGKCLGNDLNTLQSVFLSASSLIPAHAHARLKSILNSHRLLLHAMLMRRQLSRMGLDDLAGWDAPSPAALEGQLAELKGIFENFKGRLFKKPNRQFL